MEQVVSKNKVFKNIRQTLQQIKEQKEKTNTVKTESSLYTYTIKESEIFNFEPKKELSIEQIIYYLDQQDFKVIQVLGKGQIGKVVRVIHKETQIHYACKFINNQVEYENEKRIGLQLNEKLKDQWINDAIANLLDYQDEDQILFYESGDCSLKDFCQEMMDEQKYWFENVKQFNFLLVRIYNSLKYLLEHGIYHSDLKPQNIVLSKDNDILSLSIEPRLIDFSSAGIDNYTHLTGHTPQYSTAPQNGFKNKQQRDIWELKQFGRTLQKLMIQSVEKKLNIQLQDFNFLQDVKYQSLFENETQKIQQDIHLLSGYYPGYLISFLEECLIKENPDISELDRVIKYIENNHTEEFTDDDSLINQIVLKKLNTGLSAMKSKEEYFKEIQDFLRIEMFQKAYTLLSYVFQNYEVQEQPKLIYYNLFVLRLLNKTEKEKQDFIDKYVTIENLDTWKSSNLELFYLIQLETFENFNGSQEKYEKFKKILDEIKNYEKMNFSTYCKALITANFYAQDTEKKWENVGNDTTFLQDFLQEMVELVKNKEQLESSTLSKKDKILLEMFSLGNNHSLQNDILIPQLRELETQMIQQDIDRSYVFALLQDRIANIYTNKYSLNLEGDLDSMAINTSQSQFVHNPVKPNDLDKLKKDAIFHIKFAINIFLSNFGESSKLYINQLYTYLNVLIQIKIWDKASKVINQIIILQEKYPLIFNEKLQFQNKFYFIQINHEIYKDNQRKLLTGESVDVQQITEPKEQVQSPQTFDEIHDSNINLKSQLVGIFQPEVANETIKPKSVQDFRKNQKLFLSQNDTNFQSSVKNLKSSFWNQALDSVQSIEEGQESELEIDSEEEKEFENIKNDLHQKYQEQAEQYVDRDKVQKGLFFQQLASKYKRTKGSTFLNKILELKVNVKKNSEQDNKKVQMCQDSFQKISNAINKIKTSKNFMSHIISRLQKKKIEQPTRQDDISNNLKRLQQDKFFFLKEFYKNLIKQENFYDLNQQYIKNVKESLDYPIFQKLQLSLYFAFTEFKIENYMSCFQELFNIVDTIEKAFQQNTDKYKEYFLIKLLTNNLIDKFDELVVEKNNLLEYEEAQLFQTLKINQLRIQDLTDVEYYQAYFKIKFKILDYTLQFRDTNLNTINGFLLTYNQLLKLIEELNLADLKKNQEEITVRREYWLNQKLDLILDNQNKTLKQPKQKHLFCDYTLQIARIYEQKNDITNARYYYKEVNTMSDEPTFTHQKSQSKLALARIQENIRIEQLKIQNSPLKSRSPRKIDKALNF